MSSPGCTLPESLRRYYLEAMGVQLWQAQALPGFVPSIADKTKTQAAVVDELQVAVNERSADAAIVEWQRLEQAVAACTRCDLHRSRTQTVFGTGDHDAELMIIGEAPGRDEDLQGEPFVGRAGLLLNAMLRAIGFQREQVYIANILKCRPPNNRDPQVDEAAACSPYLQRQVELIQPGVILALGRIAAHNLLQTTEAVGRLRGRVHSYAGVPLIVSYHPAYLLRSPSEKRKSWQDLRQVMSILG